MNLYLASYREIKCQKSRFGARLAVEGSYHSVELTVPCENRLQQRAQIG